MDVEITADLNLAFPIRLAEKTDPKDPEKKIIEVALWAYHTPISNEVFRANHRLLALAKDAIFSRGITYASQTGIAVADLELIDASREVTGAPDLGQAFLNELRRLTFILTPGPNGFETLPAELALQRKTITEDEWKDAECVLVFFTCASKVVLRSKRSTMAELTASVLKASMTSLSPTAFAASLRTPIEPATSAPSRPS